MSSGKKKNKGIPRDRIRNIHIERRCGGSSWNITVFVNIRIGDQLVYPDIIADAEEIIRQAKNLGKGWHASHANIMMWSGDDDYSPNYLGIGSPHEMRVTLDMDKKNGVGGYEERDDSEYGEE